MLLELFLYILNKNSFKLFTRFSIFVRVNSPVRPFYILEMVFPLNESPDGLSLLSGNESLAQRNKYIEVIPGGKSKQNGGAHKG